MSDYMSEAVGMSGSGNASPKLESLDPKPESLDPKLEGLDALPVTEHMRVYEEVLDRLATELDSGEPAD